MTSRPTDRRTFLGSTAAWLGAVRAGSSFAATALFSGVGITAKVDRAAELKTLGADFIVESVADFLQPFAADAEFEASAAKARSSVLPIRGCNSFLRDPSLICVGPKADHSRVLSYCKTAFRRLQSIGGRYIVFGSSSARRIPAGWTKHQADPQFVTLLKSMGPLASKHGITVAVESLNASECNYLNHIDEVVSIIEAVAHPNIRVLADLYHMRVMGDTPAQLAAAMPWVGLVEIAEREKRTVPGVAGDDFRPYLSEVAKGGYRGMIDIEANGSPDELRKAFAIVREQSADVMRARA